MVKKSKAIKKQVPQELAVADEYESGIDDGFEEADSDSFAIPRLKVLQKMSPEVDEDTPEYIKGAKAGMFYNTATGKLYDGKDGITIVPCHFRRVFLEWIPRTSGGGFAGEYTAEVGTEMLVGTTRDEKGHDILENGNQLMDTRIHYVLIVDDNGHADPAVLSTTLSMIAESKQWMNKMKSARFENGKGAAMFAQVFILTTVTKSRDDNTWSVFKAQANGFIFDRFKNHAEIFEQAKQFRDMIKSGTAKATHEEEAEEY